MCFGLWIYIASAKWFNANTVHNLSFIKIPSTLKPDFRIGNTIPCVSGIQIKQSQRLEVPVFRQIFPISHTHIIRSPRAQSQTKAAADLSYIQPWRRQTIIILRVITQQPRTINSEPLRILVGTASEQKLANLLRGTWQENSHLSRNFRPQSSDKECGTGAAPRSSIQSKTLQRRAAN
jgi:hypothetical protein